MSVAWTLTALLASAAPAQVVADFTATPTSGVQALTVQFTNTSAGCPCTQSWDFDDGTIFNGPDPVHVYTEPGSYTVSLSVLGTGFGLDSETKVGLIDVFPASPAVAFAADVTSGNNPLTVQFSDLTTGLGPTGWWWDFGDGHTSTAQHPSHTYSLPGSHDVQLTVFLGGASWSAVVPDLIAVDAASVDVSFTATPSQGSYPHEVAFTDTSSAGAPVTGWLWDFGDGSGSTDQHPMHTYVPAQSTSFDVQLTVFLGDQPATLVQPGLIGVAVLFAQHPLPPSQVGSDDCVLADLDGDGANEIVFGSGVPIRAYVDSDGMGSWELRSVLLANGTTSSLQAADLDADGDVDLLVGHKEGWGEWFENLDGAGGSWTFHVFPLGHSADLGIEVADVDGDGDLDVLVVENPLVAYAHWLENLDGAGTLGAGPALPAFGDSYWSVALGDVDGDGLPDMLVGTGSALVWTRNLGPADAFSPQATIDATPTWSVGAADLDDDGDLDAVALLQSPDSLRWFPNVDGLGSFGPPQLVDDGHLALRFRVADLDLDGDLDLLGSGLSPEPRLIWFENQDGQAGSWSRRVLEASAGGILALVAGQLDADGDVDIVRWASTAGPSWFENRTVFPVWTAVGEGVAGSVGVPILSGTGTLQAGQSVALDLVAGKPFGTGALVVGLSQLAAPFKGGVLVPSPDLVFAGLPLDGAGAWQLTSSWPPGVPFLTMLWFQSWIADPAAVKGFAASNGLEAVTDG